jgi:hypothetical protein
MQKIVQRILTTAKNLKDPRGIKEYFMNMSSSKRMNFILVGSLIILLLGSVVVYNKFFVKHTHGPVQEVDLPFDPNGPYALLYPRRDGNALVLNITRVSDYDAISYDLEYQSDGIDRGVHGDIKKYEDNNKKSEYSQEILFGTCSQGFTSGGAHCVFDPDVENGTLTLHIVKGDFGYRMITTWHFQKPDVALGVLTSGDNHFTYTTTASREDLAIVGYTIVNDLSGAPKLPSDKKIFGKVYGFEVPQAKTFPNGVVSIEAADKVPQDAKIAKYDDSKNSWKLLDTKTATDSAALTAQADGTGIFTILVPASSK